MNKFVAYSLDIDRDQRRIEQERRGLSWLYVLHSVADITEQRIRSPFQLKRLESIVLLLIINYLFRLMARLKRNLESVGVKFKYMPCSTLYRLQSVAWLTTFICVSSLQCSCVKRAENMPREFIKFFRGSSHQRCCLSLIKLLNERSKTDVRRWSSTHQQVAGGFVRKRYEITEAIVDRWRLVFFYWKHSSRNRFIFHHAALREGNESFS